MGQFGGFLTGKVWVLLLLYVGSLGMVMMDSGFRDLTKGMGE